ncbi:hypothetical protein NM688_g7496 [Phlebia brevispora]|uniref:Uncharacterized protein n=1 Tax=Phlebia brevispora TaxID=194682 RepID=A0ACC1S538_9APHY|nr:hypothetical protein NM688_g7496 [Phlebia brevispora]
MFIPKVIDYVVIQQWEILVTEYTGMDLSVVLAFPGIVQPSELSMLSAAVIYNLERIHDRGIIHSDIKPSNITYNYDSCKGPSVTLIDFGLACVAYEHKESGLIRANMVIGSFLYMSPWVHKGYRPCRRDDVFSAAVTILALYKGEDKLPWYDVVHEIGDDAPTMEQHAHIASLKTTADVQAFTDLPPVFCQFYQYALALEFGEKPRYHTWYNTFMGLPDGDLNNI